MRWSYCNGMIPNCRCETPSTLPCSHKQNRLQMIVRPCMEEGHSIWQFQDTDREGYPKAIRVPLKSGRGVPDRAFYSAPVLRHVLVTHGIAQIGAAAWQSCHQLQIVRLPYSVTYLQEGAFQGCCALRQITIPGCVQFGKRAFAECCSLSEICPAIGSSNTLAPGAQFAPFVFESCMALESVQFAMSKDDKLVTKSPPGWELLWSRFRKSLPSA